MRRRPKRSGERETEVRNPPLHFSEGKRERSHHRAHDEEDNLGKAVVQVPPPPRGAERERGDKNDKDGFDHD